MVNDDSNDDQRMPERRYFQPPEERPNPRPRRRLPALPPHAPAVPGDQPGINLELHPVQPPQPGANVQLQLPESPDEPPEVPPRASPRPPQRSPQPRPAPTRSSRSLLAPEPEQDRSHNNGNNSHGDNQRENGQENS